MVEKGFATEAGMIAITAHEAKRVEAYQIAHDHYLDPIGNGGFITTACGTVCRDKKGEAKEMLEAYLNLNRQIAISNFNSWILAEQNQIGKVENGSQIEVDPPENSFAEGNRYKAFAGSRNIYQLSNPPDMHWAVCPQSQP